MAIPAPSTWQPVFDPRYFVYYEDLDAGWRARLRGRRLRVRPAVAGAARPRGRRPGTSRRCSGSTSSGTGPLTSLRNADPFLAVWSGVGLVAKAAQAVLRAAIGRRAWPVAWAVVRAVASYLCWLPVVLVERYLTRCWRAAAGGGRMRVILNGLSALKPKTGVGHHVANLHRGPRGDRHRRRFSLYPGPTDRRRGPTAEPSASRDRPGPATEPRGAGESRRSGPPRRPAKAA